MNRTLLILMSGAAAAVIGYACCFWMFTASKRALLNTDAPELAWLKTEFNLGDSEFERIAKLHEAYIPGCLERCQRIAAKDHELKELLAGTNVMTLEIEKTLEEAAQIRVECERTMLEHFLAVSRTMPPAQGKRYLDWVQGMTLMQSSAMRMAH